MDAGDYGVNVLFIARDIGRGEFLLLCDEIDCRSAAIVEINLI